MKASLPLLITALVTACSLIACAQGSSSTEASLDAAPQNVDALGENEGSEEAADIPASLETSLEPCTKGFDTGLSDPFRSFESIEAGRYCEVLLVFLQEDGTVLADVYNSLVFGLCPQELWEELDAQTIKEEFPEALMVVLNGPRYFLMQHLLDTPTPEDQPKAHNFGGIQMVKAATVSANASSQKDYTPTTVNRDNTWRFDAGNRVHELIDADGKIYIMQSFAQILDKDLSYEDLESLGDRLELPEGWRYRTRILESDLDVQADGTATVLQDELKNTYQWRSDCFISTSD